MTSAFISNVIEKMCGQGILSKKELKGTFGHFNIIKIGRFDYQKYRTEPRPAEEIRKILTTGDDKKVFAVSDDECQIFLESLGNWASVADAVLLLKLAKRQPEFVASLTDSKTDDNQFYNVIGASYKTWAKEDQRRFRQLVKMLKETETSKDVINIYTRIGKVAKKTKEVKIDEDEVIKL